MISRYAALFIKSSVFNQDEFPYVSPCGVEMNYIRCDDVPIVFTHLLPEHNLLLHNHAGTRLQVGTLIQL